MVQSQEARRLTAYHEAGHALVALNTPGATPIHKATIVPRGHALGMVSMLPHEDEYSVTRQQLRAGIDVSMGGRVAEELIFGEDQVLFSCPNRTQRVAKMPMKIATAWLVACVSWSQKERCVLRFGTWDSQDIVER